MGNWRTEEIIRAPHCVYRLFASDGRLLYIGCSILPVDRIYAHSRVQPWATAIASATFEWHPSRKEAEAVEDAAIRAELPEWNVHKRKNAKHSIGRLNPKFRHDDPSTWEDAAQGAK